MGWGALKKVANGAQRYPATAHWLPTTFMFCFLNLFTKAHRMKNLDLCCNDCPTREIMPEIGTMMSHIAENHSVVAQQVQAQGLSPMFAAVLVMKTQAALIEELEETINKINNKNED